MSHPSAYERSTRENFARAIDIATELEDLLAVFSHPNQSVSDNDREALIRISKQAAEARRAIKRVRANSDKYCLGYLKTAGHSYPAEIESLTLIVGE